MAQVQAGRHPDPAELIGGQAAVGQVAEHRGAAPAGADQAQVGGPGRERGLHRVLVAVPLGGDHHHGALGASAAENSGPATRSVRQPRPRPRSASVCAIGDRPTTTRCGTGSTGSM